MVDSHLQVLIPNIPGYLKDTQQLLLALNDWKWKTGELWITADVASLYSIIPHSLQAVQWFLNVYSTYSSELKYFLLDCIHYLLEHNFFIFDQTHYLQVTGASMGPKFSPSIDNIYMPWWEHYFLFDLSGPFLSSIG